ncbi:hypothetical protein [Richelia sinica]|uniref:hypothetical protein n=1 Tax=Richelia sinica TaxID=1357545 RepID=UPI001686F12D|nr:hypothetical protein [Richelia sinica]MBD2666690.1 hypothetical protein [Richelia sinica FACHB-800]
MGLRQWRWLLSWPARWRWWWVVAAESAVSCSVVAVLVVWGRVPPFYGVRINERSQYGEAKNALSLSQPL